MNMNEILDMCIKEKPSINKDDYIKDGLLHCGKCHSPKQTKITVQGRERIVSNMCDCENEAYEQRKRETAELEHMQYIKNLRSCGIQDKQIFKYTFENDDNSRPEQSRYAKNYVSQWEKVYRENIGLLFWGDVGTGKTFYAGCIANALIEMGIPVLVTDFIKIINTLQAMYKEDKGEYLRELNNYKLIIIDDLGAERQSDFALEQVFNVIDQRYKGGQPVIFTTNLSLTELKTPKDIRYGRIYDRVMEMCTPVKFIGESRRKGIALEKINKAMDILKNGSVT